MPTYIAFLGHQPHISLAELAATVPQFSLKELIAKQYALFDTPLELKPEFIDQLGGTILIAREVTPQSAIMEIPKILTKEMQGSRGKFTFGLRGVGTDPRHLKTLYRVCKDALKAKGRSCRYVGNERKPALPVMLHTSQMFDPKKGCELFLLQQKDALWVGRTIGAQNVNAYTKRDTEKPVRDTFVGLLPPKLAQIMLNFGLWMTKANDEKEDEKQPKRMRKQSLTVLDPFCGTGVIPIECLLLGWDIFASDVSQKAVTGCTKNLEWTRKEYKILKKDVSSEVWKQDAAKPFSLKTVPDVIVTETTLGPSLDKRPTQKEMSKLRTENEKIQEAFLRNVAATLPGVPVVCTWPAWYGNKEHLSLDKIWTKLGEIGFEPVLPPGIIPANPERMSLLYRRPEQFVAREIVLLKPISRA